MSHRRIRIKSSGRRILAIMLLIIVPVTARADHLGTVVRYNCDRSNDQIVIEYIGGVNEAFDELMKNKGANAWYPWDLVTVDRSQQRIVKTKTILRSCILSDGEYKIAIGPEPGNWNIQGQLGARMSAWVEISKNGKQILRKILEDVWHDQPIVSKIVLKAKEKRPAIIEVNEGDFYK